MTETNKLPVETPAEWFRFADENWRVAEREAGYADAACHTICFLCQSAAEKYLKGYLIARGWELEKTHDILHLLELCAQHDPVFTELVTTGAVLNEYITAGRYPGDIAYEVIGKAEAVEALAIVRRIRAITLPPQPEHLTKDAPGAASPGRDSLQPEEPVGRDNEGEKQE